MLLTDNTEMLITEMLITGMLITDYRGMLIKDFTGSMMTGILITVFIEMLKVQQIF